MRKALVDLHMRVSLRWEAKARIGLNIRKARIGWSHVSERL
jgi:hypothetical protein